MLDLRQGLVDAEEDDEDFTVDAHEDGAEDEEQHPFERVSAPRILVSGHNHEDAREDANHRTDQR